MKHDHGPNIKRRRRMTTSAWMALMQRQYLKQFRSSLMLEMKRKSPSLRLPWQMVKMAADRALAMVASLSSSSSHFEWASHLSSKASRLNPNGHLTRSSAVMKRGRKSHTGLLQRRRRAHSILRQIHTCAHNPIAAAGDYDDAAEEEPHDTLAFHGSEKWEKWRVLQTLIPGGNYMEAPKLLKEVAHYILFLQIQSQSLNHLLATLSA